MKHLDKFKIVAQQQKRTQTKVEHRRNKLLEKLDDQLAMIQALIAGETFIRHRRVWKTDEMGERKLIERPKRIRTWYWMCTTGCYFQVWYGSKVLELKPGMSAIHVAKREELPDVILSVMDAVRAGELDLQIEDIAEKGTAELRLKAKPTQVKKTG